MKKKRKMNKSVITGCDKLLFLVLELPEYFTDQNI